MTADVLRIEDPASGLRAVLVIDTLVSGRAFGGIRVAAYADEAGALEEARRLARAMSLKCGFAGIDGGGAKTVVWAWRDRPAAMRALGRFVESLDGRYCCGGDLGFTADDQREVASATRHVACSDLADRTGRTVVDAMLAAGPVRTVAVQGLGAVGRSVARRLRERGADVVACDPAPAACDGARAIGCRIVPPDAILDQQSDAFSPCAVGGVITLDAARRLRARIVCGGANNPLAEPAVAGALLERGVVYVPDFVANAGALIAGSCAMLGHDPEPLLASVAGRVRALLDRASAERRPPVDVARDAAEERLRAASGRR
jgi:leucine dehydrogenase